MTHLKIFNAAAILSVLTVAWVSAQAAIQELGLLLFLPSQLRLRPRRVVATRTHRRQGLGAVR
ncbi:MAG: hypothetical protein JWP25_8369 [Bradyrhizobium sp.]|jgi:hypothetical protein|nr:hypothetical protein [Bradyrhizobium sp.]MEA2866804.1 hypothetical protein [Bradyrhizobium sp.]